MLKRMKSEEVVVGKLRFRIRPFGAMNATHVFGDLVSVVLPVIGTASLTSGIEDIKNMDSESIQKLVDGLDTGSIVDALAKINGDVMADIVSELVVDYKNVSFEDEDSGEWRIMTSEDFDELFCMFFAGILKLCASVVKQNFGSFFGDVAALFGGLLKKVAEKKTSPTTGSLTKNS